jgi:hypothetical protein
MNWWELALVVGAGVELLLGLIGITAAGVTKYLEAERERPCLMDQYRSSVTGRCEPVTSAASLAADCRPIDPVTYEIRSETCGAPPVVVETPRAVATPIITLPGTPRDCRVVPFAELRACMGVRP